MIRVTRLNGRQYVLNAEMIRTVEANPDTIITLINGDHLVVTESPDQIIARVIEYGRHLRKLVGPVEGL
ncbi:MAG: flagellar FlbD family protein [Phycisphaeraceae bacterium]|nr:flagellar FlbD family protein [Phycisphaeraceae bacterium]